MEQETAAQEVVLEKVRQRLGSLEGNAEQAVAEAINPNRTALVGRKLFHKLAPIVHLDFATRQTEIEFKNDKT